LAIESNFTAESELPTSIEIRSTESQTVPTVGSKRASA